MGRVKELLMDGDVARSYVVESLKIAEYNLGQIPQLAMTAADRKLLAAIKAYPEDLERQAGPDSPV